MCGRFTLYADAKQLATLLDCTFLANFHIEKRYNIAPGQWVIIVRPVRSASQSSAREPGLARWGLVPSWAKDPATGPKPINARSEGISAKAAFRNALKYGRCIIPASGFYEWAVDGKTKTPHYIQPRGGGIFLFAGISDTWHGPEGELTTCAILTTSANSLMANIHDRQPVILDPEGAARWLNPATNPEEILQPCSEAGMEAWEVSRAVGNVKNDSFMLIDPCDRQPASE